VAPRAGLEPATLRLTAVAREIRHQRRRAMTNMSLNDFRRWADRASSPVNVDTKASFEGVTSQFKSQLDRKVERLGCRIGLRVADRRRRVWEPSRRGLAGHFVPRYSLPDAFREGSGLSSAVRQRPKIELLYPGHGLRRTVGWSECAEALGHSISRSWKPEALTRCRAQFCRISHILPTRWWNAAASSHWNRHACAHSLSIRRPSTE
jgi:hypothetical protein